jgi:hypothetical protein
MTDLTIPADVKFNQAIELSQSFLTALKAGSISSVEIGDFISQLVVTSNGARGFFVTYLTAEDPICDDPQPEIITGLQANLEITSDLLVKNIAMSVAQQIQHQRNHQPEMAAASARVTRRTKLIIDRLKSPMVTQLATELLNTIASGAGSFSDFLDRWKYDAEQKQAISQAVKEVLNS